MPVTRRQFVGGTSVAAAMLLAACGSTKDQSQSASSNTSAQEQATMTSNLKLD